MIRLFIRMTLLILFCTTTCFHAYGAHKEPSTNCHAKLAYYSDQSSHKYKKDRNRSEKRCEEKSFGKLYTIKVNDDPNIEIRQSVPEYATVGMPYPIEILAIVKKDCKNVVITQHLPEDAEFVRSHPEVKNTRDTVEWQFARLEKGSKKKMTIWIRPLKEGCCLTAATVCACPEAKSYTRCGKPELSVRQCGPQQACLKYSVRYKIEIANTGTAPANEVMVEAYVPKGFVHSSGEDVIVFYIDELDVGETKTFNLEYFPQKKGHFVNKIVVTSCSGLKSVSETTTVINDPKLEVAIKGASEVLACETVEYLITVRNTGDVELYDLIIEDIINASLTVKEAVDGKISNNKVSWKLDKLAPGDKEIFKLTVASKHVGVFCNKVRVKSETSCGACFDKAQVVTEWKGSPDLHMNIKDIKSAICPGEDTVYYVRISNRGSAADTNIKLVFKCSNEIQPTDSSGPTIGTIKGNSIIFDPITSLSSKEEVEYKITVKAISSGEAKGSAILTSEGHEDPILSTEYIRVH